MTALCPHCGYSFTADRPVYRSGWMIDPTGMVAFKGPARRIRITWANILHAVAASNGPVSTDALLNRVSDSESKNAMASQVSQMRKWLRSNGMPDPIKSSGGRRFTGYFWNDHISHHSEVHGA